MGVSVHELALGWKGVGCCSLEGLEVEEPPRLEVVLFRISNFAAAYHKEIKILFSLFREKVKLNVFLIKK